MIRLNVKLKNAEVPNIKSLLKIMFALCVVCNKFSEIKIYIHIYIYRKKNWVFPLMKNLLDINWPEEQDIYASYGLPF